MQKVYKQQIYRHILRKTGGSHIKGDNIYFHNSPHSYRLEDYNIETKLSMITYMLTMYDIKWESIIGGNTIVLYDNDDRIEFQLSNSYTYRWLTNLLLYKRYQNMCNESMLLLVSNPLKFINKMEGQIMDSSNDNIKFFALLASKVTSKLDESYNIYLVLRAMVCDNMIVDDVMNVIATVCIDIISKFE